MVQTKRKYTAVGKWVIVMVPKKQTTPLAGVVLYRDETQVPLAVSVENTVAIRSGAKVTVLEGDETHEAIAVSADDIVAVPGELIPEPPVKQKPAPAVDPMAETKPGK